MKKRLLPLYIFIFVVIFTAVSNLDSMSLNAWTIEYNYNPEGTNDIDVAFICLDLEVEKEFPEEYYFEEIVNYNYLTNNGVATLLKRGHLTEYEAELISTGNLDPDYMNKDTTCPGAEQNIKAMGLPPTPQNVSNSSSITPSAPQQEQNTTNNAEPSVPQPQEEKITCNESISGTYVVLKAETPSYANADSGSSVIKTWALGEYAEVTGLMSNGYYRVVFEETTQYIKKSNLVSKADYDAAWSETSRIESTCIEEGSVSYTNNITEETKTETVALKEHAYESIEKTDATCEVAGKESFKCSACNKEYTKELPATGHGEGLLCKKCNQLVISGKSYSPVLVGGVVIGIVVLVGVGCFFGRRKLKK